MDPFSNLPDELILIQALNLSLDSIGQLCLSNQRFNTVICNNELFWRQKFNMDYGVLPIEYNGSWKQLYEEYSSLIGLPGTSIRVDYHNPQVGVLSLYDNELLTFFAQARLGPVVEGEFVHTVSRIGYTIRESNRLTLKPTNRPLNMGLFFIQPLILGQTNPIYGIIGENSIFMLHNINEFYKRMDDPEYLTSSLKIKNFIPGLIVKMKQANKKGFVEQAAMFRDKIIVDEIPTDWPIFTPEHLEGYSDSSYMIRRVRQEELQALVPEVTRVYGPLFPYANIITPEMIFQYQSDIITLAYDYIEKIIRVLEDPNSTQEQIESIINQLY